MGKKALAALSAALIWLAAAGGVWAAWPRSTPGSQTPEPGQPIVVRWSTESEVNTAGFNIYRATSEAGPWQKINGRLIAASPDPLRGGRYVFTDTNVVAGQTYWYELEEVELDGTTTRLQRTQATARSERGGPLGGATCTGAALPAALLAAMTAPGWSKRRRAAG